MDSKIRRKDALDRAVAAFGPWQQWGRAEHLAYGILRGVLYSRIERCANDAPPLYYVTRNLMKLEAWSREEQDQLARESIEKIYSKSVDGDVRKVGGFDSHLHGALYKLVEELIVWVRKTPRVRHSAEIVDQTVAAAEE